MFNITGWRNLCEKLANSASRNCGLSHDVYVEKFSANINSELVYIPEQYRLTAIEVAREWDYATHKEIDLSDSFNAENGFCRHGIDPDCCPAGCGDFEGL